MVEDRYGPENTAYGIDFDRVLGNVRNYAEIMSDAVTLVDEGLADDVKEQQRLIEDSGGSYDMWGHISEAVGADPNKIQQIKGTFSDLVRERSSDGKNALLYPEAERVLETLAVNELAFFIYTTGPVESQLMKLDNSNISGRYPYLITQEKEKSKLIRTWRRPESGLYVCEVAGPEGNLTIEKPNFVMVDDKAISFSGFPEDGEDGLGARGYQLLREEEEVLPSQEGEIPPNVRKIPKMRRFLEEERIAA